MGPHAVKLQDHLRSRKSWIDSQGKPGDRDVVLAVQTEERAVNISIGIIVVSLVFEFLITAAAESRLTRLLGEKLK